MSSTGRQLFVAWVDDRCELELAGRTDCSYTSPPQPAAQALALATALLCCPQDQLRLEGSPWRHAIAGGTRTITLHPA